jgi:hypothetical protein
MSLLLHPKAADKKLIDVIGEIIPEMCPNLINLQTLILYRKLTIHAIPSKPTCLDSVATECPEKVLLQPEGHQNQLSRH